MHRKPPAGGGDPPPYDMMAVSTAAATAGSYPCPSTIPPGGWYPSVGTFDPGTGPSNLRGAPTKFVGAATMETSVAQGTRQVEASRGGATVGYGPAVNGSNNVVQGGIPVQGVTMNQGVGISARGGAVQSGVQMHMVDGNRAGNAGWFPYGAPAIYSYGMGGGGVPTGMAQHTAAGGYGPSVDPHTSGQPSGFPGVQGQPVQVPPHWAAHFVRAAVVPEQQGAIYGVGQQQFQPEHHFPNVRMQPSNQTLTVEGGTTEASAEGGAEVAGKDGHEEDEKEVEGEDVDGNGKRRRLSAEERLKRSRERNRLHARKTRQRKKLQLQLLQQRTAELHEEQRRLRQAIKDRHTASILIGLSGGEGSQFTQGGSAMPLSSLTVGRGGSGQSESDDAGSRSGEGSSKDGSEGSTVGTGSTTSSGSGRTSSETNSSDASSRGARSEAGVESAAVAQQGENTEKGVRQEIGEEDGEDEGDIESMRVGRPDDSQRLRELVQKDRTECTAEEIEEIRRERNRMHAKRTRDRKKLHLEATEGAIARLEQENVKLRKSMDSMNVMVPLSADPGGPNQHTTPQAAVHLQHQTHLQPQHMLGHPPMATASAHHPHAHPQQGHPALHHLHAAPIQTPPHPGYYSHGMARMPIKPMMPVYMQQAGPGHLAPTPGFGTHPHTQAAANPITHGSTSAGGGQNQPAVHVQYMPFPPGMAAAAATASTSGKSLVGMGGVDGVVGSVSVQGNGANGWPLGVGLGP
ncbi:unnamed protein product, partial [Discosporangium mesarthrocarpum]